MARRTLLIPPNMTFWKAMIAGLVEPVDDIEYLAWVRSLPSVISGRTPCIFHHLVGHGLKAKGGKVSDYMTFPLHEEEHTRSREALHVLGSPEWERRYGDQRIYVMQTLVQALHEGVLVVSK